MCHTPEVLYEFKFSALEFCINYFFTAHNIRQNKYLFYIIKFIIENIYKFNNYKF